MESKKSNGAGFNIQVRACEREVGPPQVAGSMLATPQQKETGEIGDEAGKQQESESPITPIQVELLPSTNGFASKRSSLDQFL